MSQEQFWILLSKKIAGEANAQELAELEQLMQQHPEWQYAAQNLSDLWASQPVTNTANEEDAYLLHVQRMKEQGVGFEDNVLYTYPVAAEPRTSHFVAFRKIYISIAIAASVLTAVFVFSYQLKPGSKAITLKEPNEITTNNGSRTKVQLPDGSVVWLNAGSNIKYDETFGAITRDVVLSGEAFFDVVKNKEKPFIIHTPAIDIKVLGTVFNVKAYPKDPTTETSLIHGLIEVTIKNRSNDKIILTPNEKLIVENNPAGNRENLSTGKPEPVISINPIKPNRADSTINEIQWVQNRLVFDNEPLQEIARKMERWYNVTIDIKTEELLDKRISGSFINENIDQALEALSITGRFRYKRINNTILINP